VFVFGFAKRERENIGDDELQTVREVGGQWLAMDAAEIERAMRRGLIEEVAYGEEENA